MEFLSHVVLFMAFMRNYENIKKNLCSKLIKLGIDPLILLKAIGVFLMIIILIAIFIKVPVLFGIVWISATCIAMIALIYLMLE